MRNFTSVKLLCSVHLVKHLSESVIAATGVCEWLSCGISKSFLFVINTPSLSSTLPHNLDISFGGLAESSLTSMLCCSRSGDNSTSDAISVSRDNSKAYALCICLFRKGFACLYWPNVGYQSVWCMLQCTPSGWLSQQNTDGGTFHQSASCVYSAFSFFLGNIWHNPSLLLRLSCIAQISLKRQHYPP